MLDLDRTMFFKAKFDVQADPGVDALWSVVLSVRDWTLAKAQRDGYSMPVGMREWSRLKAGETMCSPGGSVRLYAALHREGEVGTWACQHVEDQRCAGCAPRRWITEVGFEGRDLDSGTVSIITMYSDLPGFMGPLQPAPRPNIPLLMEKLLENDMLSCTVEGLPLALHPIEFGPRGADRLRNFLALPHRETPVVVVAPTRSGELPIDPEAITAQLGPNAFVCFTRDAAALDALNGPLEPNELECRPGSLRIYAPQPHFDVLGDGINHRFFSAAALREDGGAGCLAILRRALAQDVHARDTSIRMEDVKRLNRRSSRERASRRREEEIQDLAIEQMAQMVEQAEGDAREVEAELDAALDECDAVRDELARARAEIHELELKNASLEWSLAQRGEALPSAREAMERASELTVFDIGRIFVEAFPDRIDFSDRGWSSLEVCTYEPKAFWSALHSMCTVLYPLYRQGSANMSAEFGANSKFRLARGEGPQTRANGKLMRQREDFYQGRPLCIEPHISSSTGDPNSPQFIRIYFGWDAESAKLVIGETRHLTNATTRKLS